MRQHTLAYASAYASQAREVGKREIIHMDDGTRELKSGKYTLVNDEDELQYQPVYLFTPNKKDYGDAGGWIIMWQESAMKLAADKRLNLTDHRVMAVLNAKLDFQNWIRISNKDIGDLLGVARPNISVSMKKLTEMGVLILGPSVKNVRTFRLNPAFAWRGTIQQGATERRKALKVLQGGKVEETQNEVVEQPTLPF